MPSRKLTLAAAIDQDRKAQFRAVADAQSLTISCLLGLIIDDFLKTAPIVEPDSPKPGGIKSKEVFVRLSHFHYAELQRLASSRHWHRSTYLAKLFDVHLTGKPHFSTEEINALRQVARQLANMGRNIHHIAKSLRYSLDNTHHALALDFDVVKMLIDVESAMVKNLMRSNLESWGVCDGE